MGTGPGTDLATRTLALRQLLVGPAWAMGWGPVPRLAAMLLTVHSGTYLSWLGYAGHARVC